ncbi:MAG: shikimate dehydrogenase [Bacteroidota bacterium]
MPQESSHLTFEQYQHSEWLNKPHITLWGHPIEHSLSPFIHNTAARALDLDWRYAAVDVRAQHISAISGIMNRNTWLGGNITIPHKQLMMQVVDSYSSAVESIGAINTIVKRDDQNLHGENTDWQGFLDPLEPFVDELAEERAIIFGTGGAARGVVYALQQVGLRSIVLVSRSPQRIRSQWQWQQGELVVCGYENWTAYAEDAIMIINTTPLGMTPYQEQSPVEEFELEYLADKVCYDLVYAPSKTLFLHQADEAGADLIGGLDMLIGQAAHAFELWTGKNFPHRIVRKKLNQVIQEL